MITQYHSKYFLDLLSFVLEYKNNDFFYTKDNERKIVDNDISLKALLEESKIVYIDENNDDISGIILIWEAVGGNKSRNYIKYLVKSPIVLNNLLLNLIQNSKEEFFVKIKKDSQHLLAFKNNGFKFQNGRGKEILLVKGNNNESQYYKAKQNIS
jgi:hypothetical protein